MKFNELLKEERRKKGLSQEKLAELIQVSKSTVYNWESNRNAPQLNDPCLEKLSEVLNVSHDVILKSISNLYKQEEMNFLKYGFLPKELLNLDFSEYEIKLMKLLYLRDNFSSLTDEDITSSISIIDLINYLGDEQIVIDTLKSLKDKKQILKRFYSTLLEKVVIKNRLTKLTVNELTNEDVVILLNNYKGLLEILLNWKDDEVYVTDNKCFISGYRRCPDRPQFHELSGISFEKLKEIKINPLSDIKNINTADLLFSNREHRQLDERNIDSIGYNWLFYLDDEVFIVPYIEFENNPYFFIYDEENEEDGIRYEKERIEYLESYKTWQEKCQEINLLRIELLRKKKVDTELEQYFDTPPEYPLATFAYKKIRLNNKGRELLDFVNKNRDLIDLIVYP